MAHCLRRELSKTKLSEADPVSSRTIPARSRRSVSPWLARVGGQRERFHKKGDGLMRSSHSSHADHTGLPMLKAIDQQNVEPLLIDRRLFEVWFGGEKIALTATEYDLLALLHREHDRVVPRAEILEQVWSEGDPGPRVVDTYVSRLRTKLKRAGHPGVLSVRKRGYRLAGTVGHSD